MGQLERLSQVVPGGTGRAGGGGENCKALVFKGC